MSDDLFYVLKLETMVAYSESSKVREALRDGKKLPEWFMRSYVQDLLLNSIKQGAEVFH